MSDFQTNPATSQTPPNNYLVWAILTTIFCCIPFGIVSIVKAVEVNSKFTAGDYEGALQSSLAAKKWATIAAIVGIVIAILYFIFFGAVIFQGIKEGRFESLGH